MPKWVGRRMSIARVHLLDGEAESVEVAALALEVAWRTVLCIHLLNVAERWWRRPWICPLWWEDMADKEATPEEEDEAKEEGTPEKDEAKAPGLVTMSLKEPSFHLDHWGIVGNGAAGTNDEGATR